MTMAMTDPATGKTLRFLWDLTSPKGRDPRDYSAMLSELPSDWLNLFKLVLNYFGLIDKKEYEPEDLNTILMSEDYPPLCQGDASKFIKRLGDCPKVGQAKQNANGDDFKSATEDGMYKVGDTFYMLKFSQKGNLWAHKLVHVMSPEEAKRLAAMGDKHAQRRAVKFVYAGHPDRLGIDDCDKLSYEDAAAFGAMYSACCRCGRLLTNPLSVALGIGPVCGGREFGGEFEFMIEDAKLKVEAASRK